MKHCGLYIRVSTDKQAKVEEGSLEAQKALLTRRGASLVEPPRLKCDRICG